MFHNHSYIARHLLLALLASSLLALSFPGTSWHFLAWFGLIPLLVMIEEGKPLGSFLFASFSGFLFFCALTWWGFRIGYTFATFTLQNLMLGLYWGLFALIAHWFHRRIPHMNLLTLPVTWVLIEYLRTNVGFLSWSWGLLGYSQHSNLPVAGIASVSGVYGVSFLIVFVNAFLTEVALKRFKNKQKVTGWEDLVKPSAPVILISGVMLAIALIHVAGFLTADGKKAIEESKVAIIQGNMFWIEGESSDYVQFAKDKFHVYQQLTQAAAQESPTLIVWPESAVPGRIPYDQQLVKRLGDVAKQSKAYLLIGASGYDKFSSQRMGSDRAANSAFLFSPEGRIRGRYDKIMLLPFNEYAPLRGKFTWPSWIVKKEMIDAEPGREMTVFHAGSLRFGVQICWENLYPQLFRKLVSQGVDFMVSMTNDNFINLPAARYQMFTMNIFRAIENGIPIIRSSTSGVSAVISSRGQVLEKVTDMNGMDVDVEGHLVTNLPSASGKTFYGRHGDWFVLVLLTLIALLTGLTTADRFRR